MFRVTFNVFDYQKILLGSILRPPMFFFDFCVKFSIVELRYIWNIKNVMYLNSTIENFAKFDTKIGKNILGSENWAEIFCLVIIHIESNPEQNIECQFFHFFSQFKILGRFSRKMTKTTIIFVPKRAKKSNCEKNSKK